MLSPVSWTDDGVLIIRQTLLPDQEVWDCLGAVGEVAEAIRCLDIRGAPAIGVAAALGMALAARLCASEDPAQLAREVLRAAELLSATRPTAVNLFWAVERMKRKLAEQEGREVSAIRQALLKEAQSIREEDIRACRAMGRLGAALLPDEGGVLTHCNAGALATGGYGTALGVIRAAVETGKRIRVYANETRPLLQGARLTAWELIRDQIPVTLICDSAAGYLMRLGKVQACVVGADRIAGNGDTANKIGTYSVAVLARRHGIPFYIAAPTSTVDLSLPSGAEIPIEERAGGEITDYRTVRFAPAGVSTFNPAFDVTPSSLVDAIVTERGVARSPNIPEDLRNILAAPCPGAANQKP